MDKKTCPDIVITMEEQEYRFQGSVMMVVNPPDSNTIQYACFGPFYPELIMAMIECFGKNTEEWVKLAKSQMADVGPGDTLIMERTDDPSLVKRVRK